MRIPSKACSGDNLKLIMAHYFIHFKNIPNWNIFQYKNHLPYFLITDPLPGFSQDPYLTEWIPKPTAYYILLGSHVLSTGKNTRSTKIWMKTLNSILRSSLQNI